MTEENEAETGDVGVTMELSGSYEDVVSKLRTETDSTEVYSPILEDMKAILRTVDRLDGGTRSAVAEALPDETTREFDAESVVDVLRVLERYGLVELEGNTWKPGPEFPDSEAFR
jgi:hypothetical protein